MDVGQDYMNEVKKSIIAINERNRNLINPIKSSFNSNRKDSGDNCEVKFCFKGLNPKTEKYSAFEGTDGKHLISQREENNKEFKSILDLWPKHCEGLYPMNSEAQEINFSYSDLEKRIIEDFKKTDKMNTYQTRIIVLTAKELEGKEITIDVSIKAHDIEDVIKIIKKHIPFLKEILSIQKVTSSKLSSPLLIIDQQMDFVDPIYKKYEIDIEFYFNTKTVLHNKTVPIEAHNRAEAESIVKSQYPTTTKIHFK